MGGQIAGHPDHLFCEVDQEYQAVPSAETPTPSAAGGRWVRPSTPQDGAAIIALMRQAGLQPHTEPEHLRWKYWQERSDWPGPRSFVLTDGRDILAHGAVVPGTLCWGASRTRVIHMIDWAARREAVGAGVVLMKHMGTMADFLMGIGGSDHTLKIMPLLGYRCLNTVTGYVRTISPPGILKRPTGPRWKLAPRVARSLFWSLSAPRADSAGWQVRRIGIKDVARIANALPDSRSDSVVLGRTPELIRHALACPIVPVELYALEKAGRIEGYFILSYPPGQARLTDLWMNSQDVADWRALVLAAVRQARSRDDVAELAAWSSDPQLSQVFEACGFHARLTLPIYLRSSGAVPVPQQPIGVQMIDNDLFYLYFGANALWA